MSIEAETTADRTTDEADEQTLLARIETLEDENERLSGSCRPPDGPGTVGRR